MTPHPTPHPTPEETDEYAYFSKSYLVNIRHPKSSRTIRAVLMADDQAHECYMHPSLFEQLGVSTCLTDYCLETLGGVSTFTDAASLEGLQVQAVSGGRWYDVPLVKANTFMPDSRAERATSQIIGSISHLRYLQGKFEAEDADAETMLLLGLDAEWLHCCKPHGKHAPFAHETPLGWALTAKVARSQLPPGCLAASVPSKNIRLMRTGAGNCLPFASRSLFLPRHERWTPSEDLFSIREDDEDLSWSDQEEACMQKLREGARVLNSGGLELPLPIREDIGPIPDNRRAVYHRAVGCLQRISRDAEKLQLCQAAMQLYLERGHVEEVPRDEIISPCSNAAFWLLVFPVMHATKPSVRLVFDAKAEFKGVSLNSLLYAGPDLNNSLRGVLLRFRANPVAFALDIAYMFNCFGVPADQRDMLRFHWWEMNDPTKPVIQYRSRVHLFGACSSPAVAVFALKLIAHMALQEGRLNPDQAEFLVDSFYIDDGMDSREGEKEVIELINKVREVLGKYGLKVHKINSNSKKVFTAFSEEGDANPSMVELTPDQFSKALGVTWDTTEDKLHTLLALPERPFTRRGLLATINAAYDPQGVAGPVLLAGRLFQREILKGQPALTKEAWDEPLPQEWAEKWRGLKECMSGAFSICIPRCIFPLGATGVTKELHVFCDASQDAVAAVAFARSVAVDGAVHVAFVAGVSRLAPRAATTIPRLELCAALLAVILLMQILKDLKLDKEKFYLYSDSKIVLG